MCPGLEAWETEGRGVKGEASGVELEAVMENERVEKGRQGKEN